MTAGAPTTTARLVAWTAVIVLCLFIVLGLVWHGLSSEILGRIWRDIVDRPTGPMMFRCILQPTMAVIAAFHDGIKDARLGRSPYFWTMVSDPSKRADRLREGIFSTARIILLGLGMDVIYQYKVFGTFYPAEAALVAILLAFVPYLLLRGPIARIARRRFTKNPSSAIQE